MPAEWHPNRLWDWCVSEDEKKEIDPIFIEELKKCVWIEYLTEILKHLLLEELKHFVLKTYKGFELYL